MNILEIRDVTKKLGDKEILKGINLDIKKGEIITLAGPSGSGKSTLLRCLNRLIDPDHGKITYNNNDIKEMPPIKIRRDIVLVHQESIMFPGTVMENVSYGPRLNGNVNEKYMYECLKYAGLSEDFSNKDATKLSGGEKKRVALARALALKPKILLLDEPTSGIDPKKIKTVEKSIIDFTKNLQLTVVWVTHYIEQADRVSNRIANLKDGVVREVKDAKDFIWEGAY